MTKTNTRSRIVSILLVLAMLLTMVPINAVTANAADTSWTTVNTYDQLKAALSNQNPPDNIKLGSDIDTGTLTSGMGIIEPLEVKGRKQLDLNGHTLRMYSAKTAMSDMIMIRRGDLTVLDSSSGQKGTILGSTYNDSCYLFNIQYGKLTLNSGTLKVDAGSLKTENKWRRVIYCYVGGTVTINGGTLHVAPETYEGENNAYGQYFEEEYRDLLNGYCGYTLMAANSCKVSINGGTFQGPVRLDAGGSDWKENEPRIQINGGTFEKKVMLNGPGDGTKPLTVINNGIFLDYVQAWVAASFENSFSTSEVVINGGEFHKKFWMRPTFVDKNDKDLTGYHVAVKLNGGTIHETLSVDKQPSDYGYAPVRPRLSYSDVTFLAAEMLGKNAVQTGKGTFAAQDTSSYREYIPYYDYNKTGRWSEGFVFEIKAVNDQPTKILSNAWGMKSVTLDGNPIDYFKDWKGTVERMDNSTAHTLKFEWYPLASELVNEGYSYRTKCEHYISGSSAVQQTDTIAADKTSHTVTIPAGADPKVYSYDLQLNLDKNGSSVGIFSNQHIVKLVVSEAPVVDTRTSIESVTLKVPKLKEGAASGADFTLSGTNTGVSTINTVWEGIPASGAVAGNFYAARITLTAKDGYAFNTNTQVKLNGDYLSTGSGIVNGGAGMTIYVNVPVRHEHNFGTWQIAGTGNVHVRKCSCGVQEEKPHEWKYLEGQDKYKCTVCGYEIDGEKERITYVYASPRSPIAGEHPGDYTPAEWVKIGGANYTVESIVWKNMDDTDVTTFESGKIYTGTVTFKADEGFAFDGDRIYASKIFDSSNAEVVGNYTLADGGTTLTATFKLKDANVVKPGLQVKVKLPTLNDKIGQSLPTVELVDTTLPENVTFTYNVYENDISTEVTDPDYKVKPNQKYFYLVWLKLGDSTDITEITKTYNVSYEVTDGGDAETCTDLVGYGVLAMYQTPDTSKINSVALTVTAPKYGEAPATTSTGANDTLYTVGTPTWSPAVTDGKFGANTYTVSIPVNAASGYSLDENGIYTINGYVATYADGKVSYTFPQLTAPHTHDTDVQPWVYMDSGTHIKTCTAGDDFKVEAHDFSAWTKIDESTHSRTCSKCKKSGEATNYTETAEHTWVWVVDQEAALNQLGKQHEECTGCHAKRSENTEIPALRDYAVTVTGGTATVAAGTTITRAMEGIEVTVTADAPETGKVFDKWVVKAGGVTLANETSATTTFTMPGNDVKIEATYKDAPPSHTHSYGTWTMLDDSQHSRSCTCGDMQFETHTFSAWTKVDESTHSRTCSKCKKSGEATNYTETAEHTWVWVVDQEAALNQLGKQHEECTGCHAKRSENTEIPALRDYAVTVTGGTATVAAGTTITRAMEGIEVTVTADAPETGKVFDKWVVKAGGVTLANETSATTTFTMPGNDVKIEATYKDTPPSHTHSYGVYVGMTYTAGNFIYQITSIDTATLGQSKVIGVVAAKKNKITKVTIPDRADCKGYGLNVTAVGDNAFVGCKVLKKLTIGNKVTVIGKNAFKKCSKLKTVVIGKAVKTISSKAFIGDNKIKKITFKGKKFKTVNKNAFSKKAKKNIKSKKTKLKGNKKAIKLFKKKLEIK